MYGIEIRTAFTVLLLAAQIFGDSLTHQSHNVSTVKHTSSDTEKASTIDVSAHGSKLIQPVPLVANHPDHVISAHSDNFTNLLRLEDVLMVFDIDELAAKWMKIQHEFKTECAQDMTEMFRGLQQHKLWAIKSKFD